MPSVWPETGPLNVFEVQAAGLPMIGVVTGGIAAICEDDPSAALFNRSGHAGLTEQLTYLPRHPAPVTIMAGHAPSVRMVSARLSDIRHRHDR